MHKTTLTPRQIAYIRKHYTSQHARQMANHLGVALHKVRHFMEQNGLPRLFKQSGRVPSPLTEKEQAFIINRISEMPVTAICKRLHRTEKTIYEFLKANNIQRSKQDGQLNLFESVHEVGVFDVNSRHSWV